MHFSMTFLKMLVSSPFCEEPKKTFEEQTEVTEAALQKLEDVLEVVVGSQRGQHMEICPNHTKKSDQSQDPAGKKKNLGKY